ncbi:TIGR03089 family protein [Dactylosporangium sp. NPDC000555]|uniref:TIGR03089 family protein n=1 Tax=Dactylosporangium sp. NPDC000555 TaxID=3154260 RepID=UPI003326C4F9
MGNTVPSLFAAVVGKDPSLPFLTFYDDATGERTELSGATLANWVSKTANLLVDGCGLGPGDVAAVRLPAHWQTAAILLGAWTAGLSVAYGEPTAAGADVEFASLAVAERDAEIGAAGNASGVADRYVLGLAPMGLPMRGSVPTGWADYVAEVRQFGDHYPGPVGGEGTGELIERARALALPGGRLLVDADTHPDPVQWLVGPLAAGASIVLSVNSDPEKLAARAAAEQAVPI